MTTPTDYEATVRVEQGPPDGTTRRPWHAKAEVWIRNRRDTVRFGLGKGKAPEVAMRRAFDDAFARIKAGAPARKRGA